MVQVAMGWLKLCTTLFLFRNTLNIDKQLKLIRLTVITFYCSLLHLTFSLKYSYTLKYSHLIHVHSVNMCSQGGFSSVINQKCLSPFQKVHFNYCMTTDLIQRHSAFTHFKLQTITNFNFLESSIYYLTIIVVLDRITMTTGFYFYSQSEKNPTFFGFGPLHYSYIMTASAALTKSAQEQHN